MNIARLLGGAAALLLGAYSVCAPASTFTDRTAFLSTLPGPAGVLTFEGLTGGTDLSGATLPVTGGPGAGIRFPASVLDWLGTDLHLQVVAGNPTSSPGNSLGTVDSENYNTITGGTFIDLGLTDSVNAFGLTFISPEDIRDDDIRLIAGSETASLLVSDRTLAGTFGGAPYYAYFLGIVEPGSGFNSASIRYGSDTGGALLFNADDLTLAVAPSAVPAPGTQIGRAHV